MANIMAQVEVPLGMPGGTTQETPWQRLDAAILRAADAQQTLYQSLLEARMEASAAPDLPLLARLNGWIIDLNRMWLGRGPEETSGDSGLKHYANAAVRRQHPIGRESVQTFWLNQPPESIPQVEVNEF